MDHDRLARLRDVIQQNPGETPLLFCLLCDDGNVIYTQNERLTVRNSPQFREQLNACIPGGDALLVKPNRARPVSTRRHFGRFPRRQQD